jgi:type I restriction enzyme S subunit
VPELRFPVFKDIWKINSLGQASEMKAGKFVRAKNIADDMDENLYPCYGGNGLRGYTTSYTHSGKYSLIGRQGALCGNVKLVRGKFHATEHAVVVDHDDDFDTDFLYYVLINLKLNSYATGQAQPGLSVSNIETISFKHPQLPEQQKIAKFLSLVDKKIELLSQKIKALEAYKKGMMQQLFSQQIRFKQDDGSDFPDWEEKRLGDVLRYEQPTKYIVNSTEYDDNHSIPVLTAGKSFVLGYTDELNGVFNDLPAVIFDDFTLSNHFVDFNFKVKSSAMKILTSKSVNYNLKFVYERMQMINFQKGDEHKRFWISVYSKLKINIPNIVEQTKIANFLTAIDQKIEKTQQQLDQTQSFKKGLLQKMFV